MVEIETVDKSDDSTHGKNTKKSRGRRAPGAYGMSPVGGMSLWYTK
jgi:hypothetical protein